MATTGYSEQAILNAVVSGADTWGFNMRQGDAAFLRVSALGVTTSFDGDAANNRVSAIQSAANLLRTSAMQADAANLMVSCKSGDGGLFRVSAIGGTAGDNTLVDGTTHTISATLTPISANPAGTVAGLVTNAKSYDAGLFHVSAYIDSGSVSARQSDAANLMVSAKSDSAALFRVSAFIDSGSVSARQSDATNLNVSAKSNDGALFRVSGVQVDAANLMVSAKSGDANLFHVSSFIDSGSVSAKQSDANNLHVSAVQGDAGLFRVSSFGSVVTTNTGGASYYMTSSGATSQVSTVKSSAGRLYGYHLGNPAGVDQYLQIFNTSGGATAGTDTPALTLYVPTLGGAVMSLGDGIGFSTGIQVIGTSTANGSTMGASAMRINIFYA